MAGQLCEYAPSSTDDNDNKFQELVDSALNQDKEETNELLSHWEELKKNPEEHIVSSSFAIKNRTKTEITIKCESSKDMAIWKLCMTAAFVKLNITEKMVDSNFKGLTVRINQDNVERYLWVLNPLSQRTSFQAAHFDPGMTDLLPNHVASPTELEQLIDFAIEHKRKRANLIVTLWEELKLNKCNRLTAYSLLCGVSTFTLGCESCKDLTMWNFFLASAFVMFKLSYTYSWLSISRTETTFSMGMKNMEMVLKYLAPLSRRTYYKHVEICAAQQTIPRVFTNFFRKGNINILEMTDENLNNANYHDLLDFIGTVSPSNVAYNRQEFKKETEFLLRLAQIVKCIAIKDNDRDKRNKPIPLSIATEILSRKCEYLAVFGGIRKITQADAEQLVKLFHNLKKKVAFLTTAYADILNFKVGEYKISTRNSDMVIEHFEISPSVRTKVW